MILTGHDVELNSHVLSVESSIFLGHVALVTSIARVVSGLESNLDYRNN